MVGGRGRNNKAVWYVHHNNDFQFQYAAVSFIENLSAENLKMSTEEFNEKMGFINGKTDVDLLLEEDDGVEDWERILVLKVSGRGKGGEGMLMSAVPAAAFRPRGGREKAGYIWSSCVIEERWPSL